MVSAGGGKGLALAKAEPLRVIAHIDMDAFYAQIEQLRDPNLTGKPVVVVQYPTTMHGIKDMTADDNRKVECSANSIIAVSYEARKFGVKRGMKAEEAKKLCPELTLVQVPTRHGKADISLYRQNGERVVKVLEQAGGALTAVEKASIDEVYIDVTQAAKSLFHCLTEGPATKDGHSEHIDNGGGGGGGGDGGGTSVGGGLDCGGDGFDPNSEDEQRLNSRGNNRATINDGNQNNGAEERERHDGESVLLSAAVADPGKTIEQQQQQQQKEEDGNSRLGPRDAEEGMAARSKLEISETSTVSENDRFVAEEAAKQGRGSWEDRGRWEDIGAGGWAAVVSEAIGTHVAGVDNITQEPIDDEDAKGDGYDKDYCHQEEEEEDDDDTKKAKAKEKQKELDDTRRLSWWARPAESWSEDERLLACGAAVVSRLRAAVRSELRYSCTAGVCHNKLLAKLCSNMHKPNAQTVLPSGNVEGVFSVLPVEKVKGWGGKLGVKIMEKFMVNTAGEVAAAGPAELQRVLGDVDGWKAWEKSRGIDREPVKARSAPKSIGCSKTFPGKAKLTTLMEIERWLSELSKELCLRLAEHAESEGQVPKTLTVSFSEWQQEGRSKTVSRCCRMVKAEVAAVVAACMKTFRAYKQQHPFLTMLGVSVHGFEESRKGSKTIDTFFRSSNSNVATSAREMAVATVAATATKKLARFTMFPPPSVAAAATASSSNSSSSSGSSGSKKVVNRSRAPTNSLVAVVTNTNTSAAVRDADRRAEMNMNNDDDPNYVGASDEDAGEQVQRCAELVEIDDWVAKGVRAAAAVVGKTRAGGDDERESSSAGNTREQASVEWKTVDKEVMAEDDCESDGEWEKWPGYDNEEGMTGGQEQEQQQMLPLPGEQDSPPFCQEVVEESPHTKTDQVDGFRESSRSRISTGNNTNTTNNEDRHGTTIGDNSSEQRRLVFGKSGASRGFGEVDPKVLAQLPPEIQREVWMQQGGTARSSGAKRPRPASVAGSGARGGGRSRGRGGVRGRRGGRGAGSRAPEHSRSISSFFGK